MIDTGLTVNVAGQSYPVMLDDDTFTVLLGEDALIASSMTELRTLTAGYKPQRFRLSFTIPGKTGAVHGVITGIHASNRSLLTRWDNGGKTEQRRPWELSDAMPRLADDEASELTSLIVARNTAEQALRAFVDTRKFTSTTPDRNRNGIADAARQAQQAAGLEANH